MKKARVIAVILLSCATATFVYAQGYTPLAPLPLGEGAKTLATYTFSTYLSGMLKLLIAVGAGIAILTAITGGVQYIAAGINPSAKGDAKDRIQNSFIGLGLILSSYLILNTINPKLVDFNLMVKPVGVTQNMAISNIVEETKKTTKSSTSGTSGATQQQSGGATTDTSTKTASTTIPDADRANDRSVLIYCMADKTFDLCTKADMNGDGAINMMDLILFDQESQRIDLNGDKVVEIGGSAAHASCFFKKNTTLFSDALARQGILLDANGHIIEQATGEGITFGSFSGGGSLSLSRVGRTVVGSAVGYRDSWVPATSTAPLPMASITVTTMSLSGSTANISWTSSNATSCSASGGWSGKVGLSGSTSGTLSKTQSTSYYLSCSGAGGTVNTSATIGLSGSSVWVAASELRGVCAITNGFNIPFGYVFSGNDQYNKFQALVRLSSSGSGVNLNTFFSKWFWVMENGEPPVPRFAETTLADIAYTTVAQYDLNNDGTADFSASGADMTAFNACKGSAVLGACAQADFNGDSVIDDRDLGFVRFMQRDVFGSSGFIPIGWKIDWYESSLFDPTGYTDRQIVDSCSGRRAFETCGSSDLNGDKSVTSADLSLFDQIAHSLDINGDGKVNVQ